MNTTTPLYPARQRHSPARSPAWRWERAHQLIAQGCKFSRRRDDEPTRQAVRYLRALRLRQNERQRQQLAHDHPDAHAAHQLHEQGGLAVAEVQARLLAGQSPDEVSRVTAVPARTVAAYEALFFHVSDRLHAKDWVTAYAIGWWRFDPAQGRDAATVLRAYAFNGGPVLLDAVLPFLFGDRRPGQPDLDLATLHDRLERSIRLALDVEMLPWDAKSSAKISKLHLELLANAHKVPSGRRTGGVVARNVLDTLEKLAADALEQTSRPAAAPPPEAGSPESRRTG